MVAHTKKKNLLDSSWYFVKFIRSMYYVLESGVKKILQVLFDFRFQNKGLEEFEEIDWFIKGAKVNNAYFSIASLTKSNTYFSVAYAKFIMLK